MKPRRLMRQIQSIRITLYAKPPNVKHQRARATASRATERSRCARSAACDSSTALLPTRSREASRLRRRELPASVAETRPSEMPPNSQLARPLRWSFNAKYLRRLCKHSPDGAMRAKRDWRDGTTDGDLPGLNRLPRSEDQEGGSAEGSHATTPLEPKAFPHERSNDKHQRARAEVSRVKDELSLRALRCMR